jgi:1-acyl-sn-glycerol-3-phosphate acyltransferase
VTYAPASACGPGCLPKPGTTPRVSSLRQATRLISLVLSLMAGIFVAASMPVLTRPGRHRLIRGWFRLVVRASGARITITGDPALSTRPGTLLVANHVSWLDIPAILATESVRVVAKTDVRRWPVIGVMAARGGTIFIDRNRLRRLPVTVGEVAAALRSGQSVLVFPEGSTWCGRTMGRFYPAAFQAAIDAGAPVRPVALRYRLADGTPTTAAAFVGDDTLLASVRRVVATKGLIIELQPLDVDESARDRRSMATANAAAVRSAAEPRPTPVHAGV